MTMQTLAADLLAMRVQEMLETYPAFRNWEASSRLREALDTYSAVRTEGTIAAAQASDAPSFVNCERCRLAGVCLCPGDPQCDNFDPITSRSTSLEVG